MTEIPQAGLRARQMYLEGKPVRTIVKETALSLDQLYDALDGVAQADGGTLLPPIARRRVIIRRTSRAATRVALVTRLMRAAELQVHGLEQQLARAGYEPGEGERNSRAIALLARTMRELAAIDEREAAGKSGGSNDELIPLDIDELRRSLTRKLDALVAEQQGTLRRVADEK